MAIDTSIYGMIRTPEPINPLKNVADVMQIQGLRQQQELGGLKADEYRRSVERSNALRGLLSGMPNATDEERIKAMRGGAYFDEADKLESGLLNRKKTEAEIGRQGADAQKAKVESFAKMLDMSKQLAGGVMANPTRENAMAAIQQSKLIAKQLGFGVLDSSSDEQQIAQLQTPEQIRQWAASKALDAEKLLPKFTNVNLGNVMQTQGVNPVTGQVTVTGNAPIGQSPDNAATNETTRRGQDLVNARARDQIEAGKTQYDPERGVIVNLKTGAAVPAMQNGAPVGPKEKPLTDAQAKAALFGSRMEQADKILANLEQKGTTTSIPGSRAGWGIGSAITAMSSEERQMLDQAKRDFINATLRRESGAVISPSEFDNAEKQYFPQVGDSPGVIKQKAANRATARRGVLAEVPAGQRDKLVGEITGGDASGGWQIQEVK